MVSKFNNPTIQESPSKSCTELAKVLLRWKSYHTSLGPGVGVWGGGGGGGIGVSTN